MSNFFHFKIEVRSSFKVSKTNEFLLLPFLHGILWLGWKAITYIWFVFDFYN